MKSRRFGDSKTDALQRIFPLVVTLQLKKKHPNVKLQSSQSAPVTYSFRCRSGLVPPHVQRLFLIASKIECPSNAG